MIAKPLFRLGAALLFAILLSACDTGIHIYEPGVYKGGSDATADRQAAANRSDDLKDRAGSAFADR